ncbi:MULTISPECIES: hypothetical protein [Paenibacillus]|uniref:hypothetical protein n=1 Tax=Paenibacillus TaxID=44249 RepID=UPI002FDFF9D1
MKTWKDAWFIFRKDLRADRLYLIWNVIFMVYSGVMISFLFQSSEKAEVERVLTPMADFMALLLIPMIGFYFSRRSFNYLKEDSYTQMLLYYRTLPIPGRTIMRSRLIQLATAVVFNGAIFFAALYTMLYFMGEGIGFVQYISFALTWMGYALAMNGPYIFLEFLTRGRTYLWMTFALMFAVGALAFIIAWFDGSLLDFTLHQSGRFGLLSPVMWGCLAGGAILLILFSRITLRRLGGRDLAR